jgi:hypothetical protein
MTEPLSLEKLVSDLHFAYGGVIKTLDKEISREDRESYGEFWAQALKDLSLPADLTAKLIAINTLLPLIDHLENISFEDFKATFQVYLLSLIENVIADSIPKGIYYDSQ